MFRFILLLVAATILHPTISTASKIRVLFIGNSYIYVNDLPDKINRLALSSGDTLVYNSNAIGGYTFQQHSVDATTKSLIAQGNWDYVVLQEQSQFPSFPDAQVATDVYPYAKKLDSLVHVSSPCAKTVFYMTWGRKNGDAQNCGFFPPVCTYTGMDSMLQLRYTIMADSNKAYLSPVARIWRKLRQQNPSLELYQADESHPSEAGTFATACTFYSLLFRKNPVNATYNFTLSTADAATIKSAAKSIIFDSLAYYQHFARAPIAAYTKNAASNIITFTNQSQNATRYSWAFGDGTSSTQQNTQHAYTQNGTYNACLTAYRNCDSNTTCQQIIISSMSVATQNELKSISIYPNPASGKLFLANLTEALQYTLYDAMGRKVGEGYISPSNASIDLSRLSTGIHWLSLDNAKGNTKALRFVIANN